jgi:hypothetical protein
VQEQRYLPALGGGSVGALAVHPSQKFLAVGEASRTHSPNIYVYSYPDLKLRRVLANGTERAYRCVLESVICVEDAVQISRERREPRASDL